MVLSCGCDQEGRKQSWDTGVEEVVLRCFLKDTTYLEGERVRKNWGAVTERIRKVFDLSTLRSKAGV